jgi:hypothetical protein
VDRLFEDVLGILRRHAVASPGGASEGAALEAPPSGTSPSGQTTSGLPATSGTSPISGSPRPGAPPSGLVTLDGPRSRLEGYEFVLEGPRGRLRCVNTLRGFLRVRGELREAGPQTGRGAASRIPSLRSEIAGASGVGGEPITVELITIQVQGGGYRPVRKRMGTRGGGGAGRSTFRYSSAPELAADFRRFVLGDILHAEALAQAPRDFPIPQSALGGGSGDPPSDDPSDYPKT